MIGRYAHLDGNGHSGPESRIDERFSVESKPLVADWWPEWPDVCICRSAQVGRRQLPPVSTTAFFAAIDFHLWAIRMARGLGRATPVFAAQPANRGISGLSWAARTKYRRFGAHVDRRKSGVAKYGGIISLRWRSGASSRSVCWSMVRSGSFVGFSFTGWHVKGRRHLQDVSRSLRVVISQIVC